MSDYTNILSAELAKEKYKRLLTRIEPFLLMFQTEIHNSNDKSRGITTSTIPNLLGIGEGSTPQSDDLYLGIVATIKCKEPSLSEVLQNLSLIKYESYTTRKSSSLIRSFLRYNFPDEIKPIIELLKIDFPSTAHIMKFKLEIQKIKLIGASSGYYFLVGVLWQLEYYENQ